MKKIDPAFLFELGDQLRKIRSIGQDTTYGQAYVWLDVGVTTINQVLHGSIYSPLLRNPCRAAALELLARMQALLKEIIENEDWATAKLKLWDVQYLHNLYVKFETLLLAETQSASIYLVSPKGGFDTEKLTEAGETLFSVDLPSKVPDALDDLIQATRCIAFELPTAAGFHLHRGHESVLRVYWDYVTDGADRPKERNMGVYLAELEKRKKGKPAVRSHLRSIKDFHRNPIMHPEQSLDTVDEAIDLLSAIRCSIGYMLQEIPDQVADQPVLRLPIPDVETRV